MLSTSSSYLRKAALSRVRRTNRDVISVRKITEPRSPGARATITSRSQPSLCTIPQRSGSSGIAAYVSTGSAVSSSSRDPQVGFHPLRTFSTKSYPEHEIIKLPALSPTMNSGKIIEWNKNVGDKIEPGDSLLIIETDKSCIDFDMNTEGYLAYKTPLTGDLSIGQPIAIMVEESDMVKEFADFSFDSVPETPSPPKDAAPETTGDTGHHQAQDHGMAPPATSADDAAPIASPSAKRLAKTLGVDISAVKGTGPGGRIVNADITAFSSKTQQQPPDQAKVSAPQPPPSKHVAPPSQVHETQYIDIPLSGIRNAIIKSLSKSKAGTPEYSVSLSVKMDKLLKMREELNEKSFGTYKITVNDIIIKAACAMLKRMPELNSHFNGDSIRQFKTVNICIAMAAEEGLYAPVLKAADQKGLIEISNGVKDLAKKTKAGKLQPHELTDGTFTISNLGMFHIESFNSILVNPQVCILSVGIVKKVIVPCEDDPEKPILASYANFTLTSDHRAIDGHVAAKWLYEFKKVVEDPQTMLL